MYRNRMTYLLEGETMNQPFQCAKFAFALGYERLEIPGDEKPFYFNEEMLNLVEEDNLLWFEYCEPDPSGGRPVCPHIYRRSFRIPRTMEEAFDCAVQAGGRDNTLEDRKDFLRSYALSFPR